MWKLQKQIELGVSNKKKFFEKNLSINTNLKAKSTEKNIVI